jgi:hypothetical protein
VATTTTAATAKAERPAAARAGWVRASGVTPRALLLGLALTALVDLWIHWAELIMSGAQGHSAIAATSTPVGAFSVLFALAAVNLLCRHLLPGVALRPAELLVVYIMITTSSVLSSSGQLHFIIPTVAAAWHYATPENAWAGTFHRFVPPWMAQTDETVLKGFYNGKTAVPLEQWLPQMGAWIGFMLTLAFASLCLVAILRRQWVDRERLAFPTVALPLALMEPEIPIFRRPLFWIGAALPFAVSCLNTVSLNVPAVPLVNLRANVDLGQLLTQPPWNAIGNTPLSFYPFVIGIAFLIPVDVTFSCWFFFWVTRIERVLGSALGIQAGTTGAQQAAYPYLGHQGAGAFLALTLVSLWLARGYLKEVLAKVFGEPSTLDDRDEPMSYRFAVVGLCVAVVLMVGFCVAAGMQVFVAVILILLALIYLIAASRVRAETGNAWLFGPDVDVNNLMTRTFGTGFLAPRDLTVLAFMRPAVANFDLRCAVMPNQFDAYRMAQEVGASRRGLTLAIVVGTVFGLTVSFLIALAIWHGYGAEARTDAWRTSQGRVPFDNLVSLLRNPSAPDVPGIGALAFGFATTTSLMLLRTRFLWWPLHPIGYAVANTNTMNTTWMPFFLAWACKLLILRYGGARFYRQSLPFFLGLIAGDLLGGGLFTAIGAFTGINVYPINW